MPRILDVEQALLLLELEPPFDQRAVQLARRRMAKRWHPDIAPPGRQHEHQRHLQAINEAADQLQQLAETSRGGRVTRNAVKVSAAAARKARAEAGRRAYEQEQREKAAAQERAKHDPFGSRVPDHSVVHRYARCVAYPEWGVGTVTGIYFSGDDEDVQQWARVKFAVGVRTVPAGSLQFVDFSKPDAGADRVQRFMTAAQHAMVEGDYKLAAQRLIYARDAEPSNIAVLRLLPLAYRQAGGLNTAGRAALRLADLRGHARDRPRGGGGAARRAAGADRREPVGARRAAAAGADGPRRRAGGAGARTAAGPDGRGAAGPGAGPPPRRRSRRRGHRHPAGDAARRRARRLLVALCACAGPHRPGQRRDRRRRACVAPRARRRRGRRPVGAVARRRAARPARRVGG